MSAGFFESLNTGFTVGDTTENVIENNARACRSLGLDPAKRMGLKQVHSDICHIIHPSSPDLIGGSIEPQAQNMTRITMDTPPSRGMTEEKRGMTAKKMLEGDALVTDQKGLALSVVTADCAPVLFAAEGVVGAAHAGWGGALKGVLENTIAAMEQRGAKRQGIRAAIGPCIGPQSYEVSSGFEIPFIADDENAERFFQSCTKPDKLMFDLPGYCAYRLARAGLRQVDIIGHDTLAMEADYFSHRRATLRGEPARGIQISVIALKET